MNASKIRPEVQAYIDRHLKSVRGCRRVSKQEFEGELTPVDSFEPERFTLMVHAVNESWADNLRHSLHEEGRYSTERDVDLLKDPTDIRRKAVLSTSLIDPRHLSTFGRALFFLAVPFPGVLATYAGDGFTTHRQAELLEHPEGATLTPFEVFAKQKPGFHNEVVVRGEQAKIEAVGVKVVERLDGTVDRPHESKRMREIAENLKVPYLEVVEKAHFPNSPTELIREDGHLVKVKIYRNGQGFLLGPGENWSYYADDAQDLEAIDQAEWTEIGPEAKSALQSDPEGKAFFSRVQDEIVARFTEPARVCPFAGEPQNK